MGTNWSVSKNYEKGSRQIHKKDENETARRRIVILATKRQNAVITSYCQKTGMNFGELFRLALSTYFEKVGFDLPDGQPDDPNQLKIFPKI